MPGLALLAFFLPPAFFIRGVVSLCKLVEPLLKPKFETGLISAARLATTVVVVVVSPMLPMKKTRRMQISLSAQDAWQTH